jgi:alpha-galactosidase
MKKLFVIFLIFVSFNVFSQKFENLAPTPPMGWNSWNRFACNVNEQMLRDAADALITSGFIHADPVHFPSGIKALTDYIHSKGLKFGIYSCAGNKTCAGRPASRGHEYQDAITYAKWGVDYLKYDWCDTEGLRQEGAYTTMRDALYAAGRPVVFSLCEWGSSKPWLWAYGQLDRPWHIAHNRSSEGNQAICRT